MFSGQQLAEFLNKTDDLSQKIYKHKDINTYIINLIFFQAVDPIPMVALVGVIATALSLILFIVFCVTYTFKAKKCCFKHKGPAFERDTNFRIYPNDHYIVSHFLTSCTRGIHKLRL